MSFKVLLCGGSGLLGQELLRNIPEGVEVWAPSSTEINISNKAVVLDELRSYQPSLIINAAAYTNVDAAEENQDLAYAVNRDGPENLGLYAVEAGVSVIHISTDYVFGGEKCTPYIETDAPNPINVYGKSKLAGERALQQVCEKSLILRTSWLFGEYGDSFIRRFIVLMFEEESIDVVSDQYSALTRTDALSAYIWLVAERIRLCLPILWGVVHFSGGKLCSKYDLVKEVFHILMQENGNLKCKVVNPVSHDFFKNTARRPFFSLLKTNENSIRLLSFGNYEKMNKSVLKIYRELILENKTIIGK
ncbi:dTDP-4-dehydrorhamnose reductase [Paenalcaligenes sp. Me52]|uniref:dTDP-4-dehydrorhamnose reductase n=1 Tax=Paenalcaligenes sp. Me52 TaxID=3392038 RepID=UPI003D2659F0